MTLFHRDWLSSWECWSYPGLEVSPVTMIVAVAKKKKYNKYCNSKIKFSEICQNIKYSLMHIIITMPRYDEVCLLIP